MPWQFGGYATGYIISELVAAGAVGLWWQNAMNDAGVPGSVVSPHAGVYQRVTPTVAHPVAGVDEDVYGFGAGCRRCTGGGYLLRATAACAVPSPDGTGRLPRDCRRRWRVLRPCGHQQRQREDLGVSMSP